MDHRQGRGNGDAFVPGGTITRRRLMQSGAGAGAGLVMWRFVGGRAWAQPLGTSVLDATSIPKYATPLVIPPAMPRSGKRHGKKGRAVDYYRDRGPPVPAADPAGGDGSRPDHGVELRLGRPPGDVQLSGVHDRGGVAQAGARQVDQRARGRRTAASCRTCCRSTRRSTGRTRPVGIARPRRARHRPRPVPRPGADRDPPPRRPQRPRRATATPRPGTCRRRATSRTRYARVGSMYQEFRALAQAELGQAWTPGSAVFQYDNDQRATTMWYHDHTLGMTRAQRLRRAGRLLPAARRARRRGRRDAARPGAGARRPAGARVLRDPDRDPGPLLQRRRRALLPGQPRLLRGARSVAAADPVHAATPPAAARATSRRSGTRSSSATRWWSTARPGRSSRSSGGATASAS